MLEDRQFRAMREYLDFTEDDAAALRRLAEPFRPRLEPMIDAFYQRVLGDEIGRHILSDPKQVESLKRSLRSWTERLFEGRFDRTYVEARTRIGTRHVQIGLPERFMPLAMGVIRQHMVRLALELTADSPEERSRLVGAVNKVLDLELTIMLDRYHADSIARATAASRAVAIQKLSTEISHELKNLLGVIHTSVLLLKTKLSPQATERPYVERIARASGRIAAFTDNLFEFTRPKRSNEQRVEITEILVEVFHMFPAIPEHAVELSIEPQDLDLRCAASDVVRAIGNLLQNATEAQAQTGSSAKIEVRAYESEGNCVVEVADRGPGVPVGVRHSIFDPLFTTRDGAMGLGLAYARDVALAHGGRLELDDSWTEGACFRMLLPRRC